MLRNTLVNTMWCGDMVNTIFRNAMHGAHNVTKYYTVNTMVRNDTVHTKLCNDIVQCYT